MNIQQIVCFDETCRYSSIAKAAEHLHITPSGLRLSLHRLEAELGASLIVWGAHRFELTDDGRFFLERAKEMRQIYANCTRYFSGEQCSEILNLASGTNFPSNQIGDVLKEFKSVRPNCRCVCTDYSSVLCDQIVYNRTAELGFNTGPFDESEFEFYPILKFSLMFAVNRRNPLAKNAALPAETLAQNQLVIADVKPSDTAFTDMCRNFGVEPDIAIRCMRDTVIFRMISTNPEYVGLIYKEIANDVNFPDVASLPFSPPGYSKTVYLFHKKNVTLSHAALALKHFFLEKTKSGPIDADRQ